MDKDRIEGSAKKIKGAAKEAVGKLIGDNKLATDGKVDQAVGEFQSAIGKVKDDARDALKK